MADAKAPDPVLGIFLRLHWMLGGNAILAIAAAFPLFHTEIPVSLSLAACCLIYISLIAARYIDHAPGFCLLARRCVGHNSGVTTMKGGKTMNKGTMVFFAAIASAFVVMTFAIGKSFGWWQ